MKTLLQKLHHEIAQTDFLRSLFGVLLGAVIAAIGIVVFVSPYGLVPGGVFGISIVLHAIFPQLQVGVYALIIQIPLLLLSILVLGRGIGLKSVIAAFTVPIVVNLLEHWIYPTQEALRRLDPSQMLNGRLDLRNDLIVCSLIGGALIGIGTGLIIRQKSSSGGSDVIAMLIHKFTHIRFSNCLLAVDGSIVLAGFVVIGMGLGLSTDDKTSSPSWMLSFYSLITMYVLNRVISRMLSGAKDCMLVHIICRKEDSPILRKWVLHSLDRTATCTKANGLYSEADKEILMMVVRNKEIPAITEGIKALAPDSFVVINDAYDVYGFRWKELPESGTFQPT